MSTPSTHETADASARRHRGWWRWPVRIAILLGVLLVIAVLAARLLAMTGPGRSFIEARIESIRPAGQAIAIDGLDGDLLGQFEIRRLTVSDESGIWLEADEVKARWRPLALLSSHARIDLVSAQGISVLRRPELAESEQDERTGSAGLPVSQVTLGKLSIGAIDLAEGVAGPRAQFALEASLNHRPDGGELSARLEPESEAGDRLSADLFWGGPVPLSGSAQLEGPAGGLFANLARLGPGQNIKLDLEGAGEPEDWSGDASVAIAGNTALLMRARADGPDLSVTGSLNLAAHPLTQELVARLGTDIELSAQIGAGQAGTRRIVSRLTGDTLDIRAAAPLGGDLPERIEVSARSERPMQLLASDGAEMDWASLDGFLLLENETIIFDGDLSLAGLGYGETRLDRVKGPVRASYTPDTRAGLVTDLTGLGVSLPGQPAPLETASLSVDAGYRFADGGRLQIASARLRAPAIRLDASGQTDGAGGGPGLRGSVMIDGPASGLAPISLEGDWQLRRDGRGIRAIFAGAASDLPALPEPLNAWMDGRADIDLSLLRQGDGQLVAETFALRSAGIQLTGRGAMSPDGALEVKLDGTADRLQDGTLASGPVRFALAASGNSDAPQVTADVSTPFVSIAGERLADPRLALESQLTGAAANGNIRLDAGIEGQAARIETGFAVDDTRWTLSGLRLDWAGLSGSAEASAPLSRVQDLAGTLNISGPLPNIFPARAIELAATFTPENMTASASLSGLDAGPLEGGDIALELGGPINALDYSLDVSAGTAVIAGIPREVRGQVEGKINALMRPEDPHTEFTGEVNIDDIRLATARAGRLVLTGRGPELDIAIAGLGGTAQLQLRQGENAQRLSGGLDSLALAPILLLAGQEAVNGTLSGDLDMQRTPAGLLGNVELVANGVLPADGGDNPLRITARSEATGNILDTQVRATDTAGLELVADAAIPTAWLDAPDAPGFPVRLHGGGPVSALTALFMPDETAFDAAIELDLTAPIPFQPGRLEGYASISGGRFEHDSLGLVLEEIMARTDISGGEIRLSALSARDPDGGRLSGEGAYRFGGDNSLRLAAQKLQIADRRATRAQASGELRLDQTDTGYAIVGDLAIDRAEVDIGALPGAGLTTLDVRFPDGDGETSQGGTPQETTFRLDVEINAPERIFVRGQGLDAEMALEASLEGPLTDPRLYGTAGIVRGRFDLAGKRFRFAESEVVFNGDTMDAALDIEARRETESLTAIVSIGGTPQSPQVSLSSQPELPEDEVLSRVLFGRSPAELSALETARLAAALAQLAGGGGGGLLGGLQDTLGLDRLDFGRDASGASEVTTGKYIAENVYLEARTGASGLPELVLEWEPLENIEVEGDITPSESQELSIRWTRDFD